MLSPNFWFSYCWVHHSRLHISDHRSQTVVKSRPTESMDQGIRFERRIGWFAKNNLWSILSCSPHPPPHSVKETTRWKPCCGSPGAPDISGEQILPGGPSFTASREPQAPCGGPGHQGAALGWLWLPMHPGLVCPRRGRPVTFPLLQKQTQKSHVVSSWVAYEGQD